MRAFLFRYTPSMIILVDMDGVLADFEGGFLKKWQEEYPGEFSVPIAERKHFYISQDYPEEFKSKIYRIYGQPEFFLGLSPVAGAVAGVQEMVSAGHDVRICSAPITEYRYCVAEKYEWIERHLGFDFTKRVILTKDKTLVRGDYLIDDRPEIKGAYAPEWKQVLFDAPYNRAVSGIPRMTWSNWKEIIV